MSEFEYIECPEGQEQGPAVENVAPYCVPADEAMPGDIIFAPPIAPTVVFEVGFYVYKKLDPTLPAAWSNSGLQDFITAVPGDVWFTEFPGDLPAYVCGPGWGVQEDKVQHDGSFVWPESIEYPHDNIGWPPIYAAKHTDLEKFVTVPDCFIDPPVEVTLPPVEVLPPRELAETGPVDPLTVLLFGTMLVLAGFATWLTGRK